MQKQLMFKDKVIVVTGGSEGIGKALVEHFLAGGALVATCARNPEKIRILERENEGKPLFVMQSDVSREEDCRVFIQAAIQRFGDIDVLINNAGISMRALFAETNLATLRQVMDVNYWGTVCCTRYALDSVIRRKGTILAVSSIAGFRGLPGRSGYSASKFAVNGWMEALRTELLDTGVNVLWVCPGFTASNIRNAALDREAKPQGISPLDEGKLMTAEECARRIVRAIEKRKRTLVLTFTDKRTVWITRLFPSLADRLVRNFFFKNGVLVK